MKNFLLVTICLLSLSFTTTAQISTPGTGVHWNMDSLVAHYPTAINNYLDNGEEFYEISTDIFVARQDTLLIENLNLLLGDTAQLETSNAHLVIDNVQISGLESDTFPRWRVDSSTVSMQGVHFLKGGGISYIDSDFQMDSVTFKQTLHLENGVGAAVSLFRSRGEISNSTFVETSSAAISSGVNAGIGILVKNSKFLRNNTSNKNTPQLNFGDTAEGDSITIIGCTIIGEQIKAGGIGVLNFTQKATKVILKKNTIENNRYGITLIGSNITASIQDNIIKGNNIQNKPMLGGSGINLYGDESLVAYIGGNTIEGNLWGLTIQASDAEEYVAPIAYLSEPDKEDLPYPTTQNSFIENGNNGVIYALYNTNDDTIYARENYWNATDSAAIEDMIYHRNDDSNLGLVIYDDFLLENPDSTSVSTVPVAYDKVKKLTLYPNPQQQGLPINILPVKDAISMKVYNSSGELIMQSNKPSMKLDMDFQPGNYYIVVQDRFGAEYRGHFIIN